MKEKLSEQAIASQVQQVADDEDPRSRAAVIAAREKAGWTPSPRSERGRSAERE